MFRTLSLIILHSTEMEGKVLVSRSSVFLFGVISTVSIRRSVQRTAVEQSPQLLSYHHCQEKPMLTMKKQSENISFPIHRDRPPLNKLIREVPGKKGKSGF